MRVAIYAPTGRRVAAVTQGKTFTPRESYTEQGTLACHTQDDKGRSVTVRIDPDDFRKMFEFLAKSPMLFDRYIGPLTRKD